MASLIILPIVFAILLLYGVPVSFSIGVATVLTLIVTPAALQLVANGSAWRQRRRERRLKAAMA